MAEKSIENNRIQQKAIYTRVIRNIDAFIKSSENEIDASKQREIVLNDALSEKQNELIILKELGEQTKEFSNLIKDCEEKLNQVQTISDLSGVQFTFQQLKENYIEEYEEFHVEQLLLPVLINHFTNYLQNWNILANGNIDLELIQLFIKWKETLDNSYDQLIRDVWLAHVEQAVSKWNPRQSNNMVLFIQAWKRCLPPILLDYVLDELILKQLDREVERELNDEAEPELNHQAEGELNREAEPELNHQAEGELNRESELELNHQAEDEVVMFNSKSNLTSMAECLQAWMPLMDYRLEPLFQKLKTN